MKHWKKIAKNERDSLTFTMRMFKWKNATCECNKDSNENYCLHPHIYPEQYKQSLDIMYLSVLKRSKITEKSNT